VTSVPKPATLIPSEFTTSHLIQPPLFRSNHAFNMMMINPGFTPHSTVLTSSCLRVFFFFTCLCVFFCVSRAPSRVLAYSRVSLHVLACLCVSSRVFACPRTLYMPLSDTLSHTRPLWAFTRLFFTCFLAPPRIFHALCRYVSQRLLTTD